MENLFKFGLSCGITFGGRETVLKASFALFIFALLRLIDAVVLIGNMFQVKDEDFEEFIPKLNDVYVTYTMICTYISRFIAPQKSQESNTANAEEDKVDDTSRTNRAESQPTNVGGGAKVLPIQGDESMEKDNKTSDVQIGNACGSSTNERSDEADSNDVTGRQNLLLESNTDDLTPQSLQESNKANALLDKKYDKRSRRKSTTIRAESQPTNVGGGAKVLPIQGDESMEKDNKTSDVQIGNTCRSSTNERSDEADSYDVAGPIETEENSDQGHAANAGRDIENQLP